jgi:feruloyl esterase
MKKSKHFITCVFGLSIFIILMSAGLVFSGANPTAPAAPYTIQSLNTPFPEFVSSGNSVLVRVMGPSTKAVLNSSVRLNGNDVTQAFSSDGEPGSMTGTVSGLIPGVNTIQVYPSKKSKEELAKLTVSTATMPKLDCRGLTSLTIPPELLPSPSDVVQITSAVPTAATSSLPEHCIVQGKINERTDVDMNGKPFAIGIELRLPAAWSGRFFFQGGGGNDGSYTNAIGDSRYGGPPALSRGFATTRTDGGHIGGSAYNFGFDPQARVDHAYNAFGKTAAIAKAIINLYYGKMPDKSYFVGSSGGGRQGMMFTQRYPEYFDGVLASAPAMSVATKASISLCWEAQAYNAIGPLYSDGKHILSQAFSNDDLTLVANAVLQECDALDGVVDGMINNRKKCTFDPSVLECAGAKDATCLSPEQVSALKMGFGGPYNSAGEALYFSWPWDAGISASGWRSWKLGTSATSTPNAAFFTLMQDAIRHEFFTPWDPTFSILDFNFDTDPARMEAFGEIYDTWKDVELSAYKAHGGKLVIVHGVSDPIFNANESVDYYKRLMKANHGPVKAGSFARLFLVPGMNHSGGGPATDRFDTVGVLINWVENGNAPEKIIAQGNTFPGRTRPLCPYPTYARYTGKGSIEDADSFVCSHPERRKP